MKIIKRIIPRSMKPIGEKLAGIHCRSLGINGEDYEQAYKDYQFGFNDQAYGLSMTPSGLIGQNPSTPKISKDIYAEMFNMFNHGKFADAYIGTDELTIDNFERQFRSVVTTLCHSLLEAKYKVKIKSGNGGQSDFSYKEGVEGSKENEKEKDKTVLSHYLRYFYMVKITKALEKVFIEFDEKAKLKPIGDSFAEKITEVLGTNSWQKSIYQSLGKKTVRREFVSRLYGDEKKSNAVAITKPKEEKGVKVKEQVRVPDSVQQFSKALLKDKLATSETDESQFDKLKHFLVSAKDPLAIDNGKYLVGFRYGTEKDIDYLEIRRQKEKWWFWSENFSEWQSISFPTFVNERINEWRRENRNSTSPVEVSVFSLNEGKVYRVNDNGYLKFLHNMEDRESFEVIYNSIARKDKTQKQNPQSIPNDRVYFAHDEAVYFDRHKLDDYIEKNLSECKQIRAKKGYVTVRAKTDLEIKNADMHGPVVFGSFVKGGKVQNFLIVGEAQILKSIALGLPSVDCLVLCPYFTLRMIKPTDKTIAKIKVWQKECVKYLEYLAKNN